jgi:uncharacterized protein YggE
MAPLEINVTGTGTAIHRAERATLVLQAQAQQCPTAQEASSVVTTAANELRNAIMPYCPPDEETGRAKEDAAVSHYSMSTLDTSSRRDVRPRTAGVGRTSELDITYSARGNFNIKFTKFDVLEKLTTQFSAMDGVRILRIDWHLTDATLASTEADARKRAAQNALQRARDYAEVFANLSAEGAVERVQAVDVRESGYGQQTSRQQRQIRKQMMSGPVTEKTEMLFEPEDVILEVKIDAKFVVEP